MNHMFDVSVAQQVGTNAAIIFQNIAFWCHHSEANGTNYHDGMFWTYSSVKAFTAIFPYMTPSQINTAIAKLLKAGMIIKGNYNKSAYDRTAWYAITEYGKSIYENSKMDLAKRENPNAGNSKPIPDINPDMNKKDINTNTHIRRAQDFEKFYSEYPRKVSKRAAIKAWNAVNPDSGLSDIIIADVRRRCETEWRGQPMQYIPHPATYLNQRRWEDETAPTERRGGYKNPALDYEQRDYAGASSDDDVVILDFSDEGEM